MFKFFLEMIWYLIFFAVLIFALCQGEKQVDRFTNYLYKKLKIDYHYKDKITDCVEMVLAVCMLLYSAILIYGFYLATERIF